VAKYRLAAGGHWLSSHKEEREALQVAEMEALRRDDVVVVLKSQLLRQRFIAAYPKEREEAARDAFHSGGSAIYWGSSAPGHLGN